MSKKMNNERVYSGGGPRPDNRKHRQEEAKERNESWASLSPAAQLKELDRRLGPGMGAKKQRAKIKARVSGTQFNKAFGPDKDEVRQR